MNSHATKRPGAQAREAKTLSDFFTTDNFGFYRNYCFPRTIPGETRSVVLYDRSCPICRTEMHRLKARDQHQHLSLIDISAKGFDPEYWGFPLQQLSAALHVQQPDGRWLIGMAAIRHVYAQVGLGWVMAPSGWPLLSRLADRLYANFAPNRQVLSRWLGLQTSTPCSDELCDSGPVADSSKLEASHHV